MHTLIVCTHYPWPADDGVRTRISHVVNAALRCGTVELWCLDGNDDHTNDPPSGVSVYRTPEGPRVNAVAWIGRWMTSRIPRRISQRDFKAAAQHSPSGAYDLCLVEHPDTFVAVAERLPRGIPWICDLDNLENYAIISKLASAGPPQGLVGTAKQLMDREDTRRWDRLQRQIASRCQRVLVCSELDVERSGVLNAVCVPNGYELVWDHRAHRETPNHTMVFIGQLGYEPNVVGIRWFVDQVLPLIREVVPDAQVRIVGRGSESVADLGSTPGVVVVGAVDSLEDELQSAGVVIVPLRSGAGTRLKVIEALANQIPLVTTTIGCEGIDLLDGVHCRIVDHPTTFADACVESMTDLEKVRARAQQGYVQFEQHYQWSTIESRLAELLRSVANHRG